MIRQPSTYAQLHAWWRAAVAGEKPPYSDGDVHCGFYKRTFVRNGPWVPVRIRVEREIDPVTGELASPEILRMDVGDKPGGDPFFAFAYLTPITREEYERLLDAHRSSLRMQATHAAYDLAAEPARP